MKISDEREVSFEPFTITIETEEEMYALWHRLNVPTSDVDAVANRNSTSVRYISGYNDHHLWKQLNEFMKERGYRS